MTSPERTRRRTRVFPFILLMCALLIAAAVLLVGWLPRREERQKLAQEHQEQQSDIPKVSAIRVRRAPAPSALQVPGTTLAFTEAYIYARASGYVSKRLVDIGDRVRGGQLLAVIDAPDLDRQVAQAEGSLAQSEANLVQMEAQLHLASVDWDRYKFLVKKGVFSRQQGDTQEASFRVAEANVKASANLIEVNRQNLNRMRVLQSYEQVRAPFTGVITARNIDVGTLINGSGSGLGVSGGSSTPGASLMAAQGNNQGASGNLSANTSPATGGAGGGQMFAMASTDKLRVLVSVPEAYSSSIQVGQHASTQFPDRFTQRLDGKVTRTSASIDQNTRTLLVEVVVNNTMHLVPGMYVVVSFAGTSRPPITIPGSAIAVRNGKTSVALIDGQTVHTKAVAIGRDFGDETQILAGIDVGDVIATTISDDTEEGSKVDPQIAKDSSMPQATDSGKSPGGQNRYGAASLEDSSQKKANPGSGGGSKGGDSKADKAKSGKPQEK